MANRKITTETEWNEIKVMWFRFTTHIFIDALCQGSPTPRAAARLESGQARGGGACVQSSPRLSGGLLCLCVKLHSHEH